MNYLVKYQHTDSFIRKTQNWEGRFSPCKTGLFTPRLSVSMRKFVAWPLKPSLSPFKWSDYLSQYLSFGRTQMSFLLMVSTV